MIHVRKQLRDKLKILVEAAIKNKVFLNRTKRIAETDLPCCLITVDQDAVQPMSINNLASRNLLVLMKVHVKALESVDDDVDALCLLIENAVNADTTIDSFVSLENTSIDFYGDSDQQIAVAEMRYLFTIHTTTPDKVI